MVWVSKGWCCCIELGVLRWDSIRRSLLIVKVLGVCVRNSLFRAGI